IIGQIQKGVSDFSISLEEVSGHLERISRGSGSLNRLLSAKGWGVAINGAQEFGEALAFGESGMNRFGSAFAGFFGISDELAVATDRLAEVDRVLAQMDPSVAADAV